MSLSPVKTKSHRTPWSYYVRALSTAAFCLFAYASTLSTQVHATTETPSFGERSIFSDRAIRERIAPVGSICLEGQKECDNINAEAAKTNTTLVAANEPLTPESIFNSKCASCHNAGIGGAPKPGSEEWQKRLSEKGIDLLLKNAISGFNAMPAKGMCADCADEDLKATIEYMINKK